MKMMHKVGASSLAFALAGCAFGPQMQRVAIDQNTMIADTANELTLVNILRARDREPLHFTSIAKATGSATLNGKAGSNVAIRGGSPVEKTGSNGALVETVTTPGVEVFTPALEASITTGSTLDIAIFDTQEFYQGITTSLTSSNIVNYLHQGWPPELLMYLMIESVQFTPAGSSTAEVAWSNDPENPDAMHDFADFVKDHPFVVTARAEKTEYVAPASDFAGSKLADFLQLDGKKFSIVERDLGGGVKTRWLARTSGGGDDVTIKLSEKAPDKDAACVAATRPEDSSGPPRPAYKLFSIDSPLGPDDASIIAQGSQTDGGKCTKGSFQITLRSAEGIIYYLGETLRQGSTMPQIPNRRGSSVPLLVVADSRPKEVFIHARYRGRNWFVPHDPGIATSRTSQVVALVQQLVNLQKLSKDKPTTQSIRVLQ